MAARTPLSVSHPELSSQWHPTLNNDLTPSTIGSGSKLPVWWLGDCGHEWEAAINSRAAGRGCHYCSNYKVLAGFNDLATTHPEVASQWHPTKNENPATTIAPTSHKKTWWLSDCGHEWEQAVVNRVNSTQKCPVCSGEILLAGYNDFATTHPELASQWHPTKNTNLAATQVSAGSNKKVWWLGNCGHEWFMQINSHVSGQGCAVCSGKQTQTGVNDLASQVPELAAQWHPTKNKQITPTQVTKQSARKIWWLGKCGHEWEAPVYSRVNGNGCPTCSRKVISYEGKRGTVLLIDRNPELTKEWDTSKNPTEQLATLVYGSKKPVWWKCSKGHSWEASPLSRVKGSGCPVCANKQVLVGYNDLATTHPDLAAQWHPTKNPHHQPTDFTYGFNMHKVWWLGECGHEWEAVILGRSGGYGCPACSTPISKGEQQVHDYVKTLGFAVTQSDRSVLGKYELDIYIPEKHFAIEYNGIYWHSEKFKSSDYHKNKWLACKEQGIQLFQVWEDDWNRNPELVKRMIAHKLGITQETKVHARKTRVTTLTAKETTAFLTENHLQGYRVAKYFGLKTTVGDTEKLVAVMGVATKGEDGLEIIRFASNVPVVGGFSKLLSHAVKQYENVEKVYSYSHNDHSWGDVYMKNGFELVHDGKPGYFYVKSGGIAREHRLKYSPAAMKKNPSLVFKEGLSEKELAALNGLVKVWDAGSSLWVKELRSL